LDQRQQAAAVDRNFIAGMRFLAEANDEGIVRTFGTVQVAATGLPVSYFNPVFVTASLGGDASPLHAAAELLRERQLPFVVHARADLDAATLAAVDGLGLTVTGLMPGMAMPPRPPPPLPPELVITQATEESFLAGHRVVAAAAFGLPLGLVERLLPLALLSVPGVRVYVGMVDGVPVASGLGYRTGEVQGIYNIGTVEAARGRGYGAAMTWAAMSSAAPGARLAVLQASAMGFPIYARMGFQTVVEYRELEAAPTSSEPAS
jgi:hypothetical protein